MIDIDYSFIRLRDNFNDAKNLGESPYAEINYYNQIQLLPKIETYLQITNTPNGISFQSDYTANLVNCSNEVLENVTDHVFIREFTDYKGIQQIEFEIVNLPTDYNNTTVYLRIESNTNPNYVFWSNGFKVTSYDKKYTSRFDYRNSTIWQGTDYETTNTFQSIRINCAYVEPADEDEIEEYYQITQNLPISARTLIKNYDKYLCENMNAWTYRRLKLLLTSDNTYIDCVKCYITKNIELNGRIELSNINIAEFTLTKDFTNIYNFVFQIYEGFKIIDLAPAAGGSFTPSSIGNSILVRFNDNISINTGTLTVYDSLDNIVNQYNETDITSLGNSFEINDSFATSIGNYYIRFDEGLVQNSIGVLFEGINDNTTWTFSIGNADFSPLDFDNSDFFTT